MDTKPISYILSFPPSFLSLPTCLPLSLVLSVCPGCPPLFHSLGLFIWVAIGPPLTTTHTQTQSMHFRQGANDKINYQQAKALALHFYWRERKEHGGFGKEGGGQEMEGEKGREDKNERQKWIARRVTGSKNRREKMEEMRERG